ncbi:MAG: ABC transporter ATP-binding protein [Lachnospiraceae bacterium]|nr:ABC transporter ATP-binding protein/permease [Lachnospiraceae bacterium]MDD5852782.1 ABC transporter ATP-binding protein [Lachnospiraceae bacterium]
MKSLLKYLKEYKKESILAPLFKMLEATFELMVPLVIGGMINVGIARMDRSYILTMGFVLVVLGLTGLICSITAQYYAAKAATGCASKLRYAMFTHIQALSYEKLDTVGTSTLITRMTSDINQVQSGVNMFLRLFLRSPFIVIGAVVMAFYVDVKAALVFAVAIPILSLVVFAIVFANIPLYKKVQDKLDKVTLSTRENLNGVRVIRAFCREKDETAQFHDKNQTLTKIQLVAGRVSALLNPLTYVIINLALVALLYKGAFRVDMGGIKQGDVVSLVNYMSQILVELVKLANLIVTLTKAMACASRIENIMEIEEGMDGSASGKKEEKSEALEDTKSADGYIVFDNAAFAYCGSAENALDCMNFSVQKGQTIGIIGGTGSGKSTLVQLIPRLYDVTEGHIYVDGKDVRDYEPDELRKRVGFVPQKAALFKGTIRDNICFGKEDASEEAIDEAIRIAQAEEFIDKKEDGLDTMVEQGGRNLSGGQRQRLTIARALVRRPDILILDDSCSALDYATDAALRKGIAELSYKPTVFIVSQRTVSIQEADQIIVLDDGAIVGIGRHEELLDNCEVYREIYDSQYKGEVNGND